ncbi:MULTISPECIES: TetR/AcrR family transcriptional regulator [unclassified Leifsonia]|uniref:TetR/AcrR family transcriptional regulator n=1 Tax=unclassified Leifsonia TaxID=2663824 RepID=UPI000A8C625B|nr:MULTISPECIES: TetR/AcrR family transcriptional regulator [unclassified Leifsonia]
MKARESGGAREYRMAARAESAEQTGERIVDAMLARLRDTPYERIRLDDIAADAGVSVQTVIRRFDGKAGLMTAVVGRELGRIVAARDAAEHDSVARTVTALVEHYEVYAELILKTYSEAPLVPGLAELVARGRAYHVDWCRRTFERHLDPSLDAQTRRLRLAQIVAVCDATTWRILRFDGGLTPGETERALGELLAPLLD